MILFYCLCGACHYLELPHSYVHLFMVSLPHYVTNSMRAGTLSLPLFAAFLVPTVQMGNI